MRSPLWDPVLHGRAALPHMARQLCSRVPTMVYTSGMRMLVCMCVHQHAQTSPLKPECARISEGAIFETSSRRARDLRSVVVASIITATIGSKFIGISIKATRTLVHIFFGQREFFLSNRSDFDYSSKEWELTLGISKKNLPRNVA